MLRCLALPALAGAALLALAAPASAAQIEDVRIGEHDDYTRIVFDLDAAVDYELERREGTAAREVVLRFSDAAAKPRMLETDAPLVRSVRLSPTPEGVEARVGVSAPDVAVDVFPLREPHRIVLDVRSRPVRAAAEPPEGAPSPAGGEAGPGEAPTAAAETEQPFEPAEEEAPAALAPGAELPESLAHAEARRPEAAGAEAATAEEEGAAQAPPAAEGARPVPPPAEPDEMQAERARPPEREEPQVAARAPEGTERGAGEAGRPEAEALPPVSPAGDGEGRGMETLVAVLAVILVLLVVYVALRRRARRAWDDARFVEPEEEEEGLEPTAEAAAAEEAAAGNGSALPGEPPPVPGPASTLRSEEPAEEPAEAEERPAGPAAPSEPERGLPEADVSRAIEEMDRRVQHLETRLLELVDTRDRLERQVSAQAEELRVQRAAIARAQRVLRALVRPDETAGNP